MQVIFSMNEELQVQSYVNPLAGNDFPDPSLIYVPDQGYFAYATHDEFSPTINNILLRQSWDLIHWSDATGALRLPPAWAKNCHRFWCPQVVKVDEEYRLYYAAEPDTKDGMCLALATSGRPADFVDCGFPISRLPGSTYQMIDPCFFIDPVSNRHFLYYGSAHEPIRVVEMALDGKSILSAPVEVLYPGEGTFHRLREGAFITYDQAWKRYYMWVSGDNTWAEQSYAISLYWSEDPSAVFQKIPGDPLIIRPNEHWDSPGQNCIISDAAGDDWIIYHAVDTSDRFIPGTRFFKRKMCMDKILYTSDGWPYVQNGSPSFTSQLGPVTNRPDTLFGK